MVQWPEHDVGDYVSVTYILGKSLCQFIRNHKQRDTKLATMTELS